jgi:hypothetical protein
MPLLTRTEILAALGSVDDIVVAEIIVMGATAEELGTGLGDGRPDRRQQAAAVRSRRAIDPDPGESGRRRRGAARVEGVVMHFS